MQFTLDKSQNSTLFEQAREQLITALHVGKLKAGDRLPSVRQLAKHNSVNHKTAFAIYQRLSADGYIELRTGSGAFVSKVEQGDLDQIYCLSILRLIRSSIAQADQLKLDPDKFSRLLRNFVNQSDLGSIQVAVVECNEEQVNLFTEEIRCRLGLRVFPLLIERLKKSDNRLSKFLSRMDLFITTGYHFSEVKEIISPYGKKILELRLNPAFLTGLIAAARRGKVLMIVSNKSYFPAFRQALLSTGTPAPVVNNLTPIDDSNLNQIRAAISDASFAYISPICRPQVRTVIPQGIEEIRVDTTLSEESLDLLQAFTLLHTL